MKFIEHLTEKTSLIVVCAILVLTLGVEIHAAENSTSNTLTFETPAQIGFWSSIFSDFTGESVVNQSENNTPSTMSDNNKNCGDTVIKFRFFDLFL